MDQKIKRINDSGNLKGSGTRGLMGVENVCSDSHREPELLITIIRTRTTGCLQRYLATKRLQGSSVCSSGKTQSSGWGCGEVYQPKESFKERGARVWAGEEQQEIQSGEKRHKPQLQQHLLWEAYNHRRVTHFPMEANTRSQKTSVANKLNTCSNET